MVSWNFKHIVNIQKIKGYNAVNLMSDYKTIEIRIQEKFLIMKTMTKKGYGCVKSVGIERDGISQDTGGMGPKEIIEYFKKRKHKVKS